MHHLLSIFILMLLTSCVIFDGGSNINTTTQKTISLALSIADTAIVYENESAILFIERENALKILNKWQFCDSICQSMFSKISNGERIYLLGYPALYKGQTSNINFFYAAIVSDYLGKETILKKGAVIVIDKRTNTPCSKIIKINREGIMGGYTELFCFLDKTAFFEGKAVLGE